MHFDGCSFGRVTVDGESYDRDIVISGGEIHKRKKKASKEHKSRMGHTPLSAGENIPWECKTLYVGTGMYGSLPVLDEVREEARRRSVELVCAKTPEIIDRLNEDFPSDANVILHLTC